MTNGQFKCEKSYYASVHIMNIILKKGLINKKEYDEMCSLINKKYRPILGGIFL